MCHEAGRLEFVRDIHGEWAPKGVHREAAARDVLDDLHQPFDRPTEEPASPEDTRPDAHRPVGLLLSRRHAADPGRIVGRLELVRSDDLRRPVDLQCATTSRLIRWSPSKAA